MSARCPRGREHPVTGEACKPRLGSLSEIYWARGLDIGGKVLP